jgi:hypothetical protein
VEKTLQTTRQKTWKAKKNIQKNLAEEGVSLSLSWQVTNMLEEKSLLDSYSEFSCLECGDREFKRLKACIKSYTQKPGSQASANMGCSQHCSVQHDHRNQLNQKRAIGIQDATLPA